MQHCKIWSGVESKVSKNDGFVEYLENGEPK